MALANERSPLQDLLEKMSTRWAEQGMRMDVRSYSGRGMFGEECLAAVIDDLPRFMQDLVEMAMALDQKSKDSVVDALGKYRQDQMGHGLVVYFPGILYSDVE